MKQRNVYGWLTNKKNSDNKYEDALKIWNAFKLKTMKDYYKLLHHYQLMFLKNLETIASKTMDYVRAII